MVLSRVTPQTSAASALYGLQQSLARYQNTQNKVTSGKAILRAPASPPTLRHLLTHTSGLCYDIWDANMRLYTSKNPGSREDMP